jgi:hypothetical protein
MSRGMRWYTTSQTASTASRATSARAAAALSGFAVRYTQRRSHCTDALHQLQRAFSKKRRRSRCRLRRLVRSYVAAPSPIASLTTSPPRQIQQVRSKQRRALRRGCCRTHLHPGLPCQQLPPPPSPLVLCRCSPSSWRASSALLRTLPKPRGLASHLWSLWRHLLPGVSLPLPVAERASAARARGGWRSRRRGLLGQGPAYPSRRLVPWRRRRWTQVRRHEAL